MSRAPEWESFLMSAEIIFPTEPVKPRWWDEPCSKSQRETMDRLRLEAWIDYNRFLAKAGSLVGRKIDRLGDITKREAGLIIDWLESIT